MHLIGKILIPLAASGLWLLTAHAGDWPQFLGPTRNGAYPGTDLASTWPKDGPPLLWQKKSWTRVQWTSGELRKAHSVPSAGKQGNNRMLAGKHWKAPMDL